MGDGVGAVGKVSAYVVCFPKLTQAIWPDFGEQIVARVGSERHQIGAKARDAVSKEKFDFQVKCAPDGAGLSDELTAPSIDSVLEKLGLRLERAKGPSEFLVVDHVEKPSER